MGQVKIIYNEEAKSEEVKYKDIKQGCLFEYCSEVYYKTYNDEGDNIDIELSSLSVSPGCSPNTQVLRVEKDISIKLIDRT